MFLNLSSKKSWVIICISLFFCFNAEAKKPQAKTIKTKTTTQTQTTTSTETTEAAAPEKNALETAQDMTQDSLKKVDQALTESAQIREKNNYGLFLNYSPIDLIIPHKIGLSLDVTSSDKMNLFEFQYLKSSISAAAAGIDFASLSEQRISFLNRNFTSGSNFNWYYGLSYISLQARLGDIFMSSVGQNSGIQTDMLTVDSLAFDIGLGNRWYFQNGVSFGIDWLGLSQPFISLKKEQHFTDYSSNAQDKHDVETFLNVASIFPRIYLLKFQLGYNF